MKPYERSQFPHERDALKQIYEAFEAETAQGALHLFCNVELVDPSTGRLLECDMIVVSGGYLAVVELKHYRGHIEFDDYEWRCNGRGVPAPHSVNNHKTKVLKGLLAAQQPAVGNWPFVHSTVVLTHDDAEVTGALSAPGDVRLGNQTFGSLQAFIAHLRARLRSDRPSLDARTLATAATSLKRIEEAPKQFADQVPGFEVLSELRRTGLATEYLALPHNPLERSLKRLRVFGVLSNVPEEAAKQRRNLDLVAKLPPHPHVVRATVVNAGNLLVEESPWSETGTLRSLLKNGKPLGPEAAGAFGLQILEALVHVHRHGVFHRDITPENVLILGATAQLMNFDRAYDPDAEHTVLDATELSRRSPYRADDYASVTRTDKVDMYAFGVLLYELFVGVKPFASWQAMLPSGGRMPDVISAKLSVAPEGFRDLILDCVTLDSASRPTAEEALERLGARPGSERQATNAAIEPGERYDTREVVARLGLGASAQVYLARNVDETVVLKIFNVETPSELRDHERAINRRVSSPAVARLRTSFQWKDGRHGLEFEHSEGRSLKECIQSGDRPTEAAFLTAADAWLRGLSDLHEDDVEEEERKPIVHNDLNPGNLLVGEGNATLIDLGSASEPGIGPFCGIPSYVAPELNLGGELERSVAGDLFSLAASMFEWVTGRHPFGGKLPGAVAPALDALDGWAAPYSEFFESALSISPDRRFESACAMRDRLNRAMNRTVETESPVLPVVVEANTVVEAVPDSPEETQAGPCSSRAFVGYLNSLHSVSALNENALAESQALSPYFSDIHVEVKGVTSELEAVLRATDDHVVVLSGHAGDGKSTIALDLFRRLKGLDPHKPLEKPLEAIERFDLNGRSISIVKDLSELAAPERLGAFRAAMREPGTWLIIANTGPLLNTCRELAKGYDQDTGELEHELLRVLEAPLHAGITSSHRVAMFEKPMVVANLTRYDNVPLAGEVLGRILESEAWTGCGGCAVRERCPITLNVAMLKERPEAIDRVMHGYRRLTDYDRRLTLRQLTAHLAYALTGGLECATVAKAHADVPAFIAKHAFSDQFFGYHGASPSMVSGELQVIRLLRPLELGARPSREVDSAVMKSGGAVALGFGETALALAELKLELGALSPGRSRERQSLRRLAYFFAGEPLERFRGEFLRSPKLLELEQWISKAPSKQERKRLRNRTLGVVLEEFTGFSALQYSNKHDELYVTLRRGDMRFPQMVQLVLAEFDFDDFDFEIEPKARRAVLRLELKTGDAVTLELALPLLDYIAYRQRGEVGEALDPIFRSRLDVFKSELLLAAKRSHDEPCEDVVKVLQATVTGALRMCEAEFRDDNLHVEYV